MSERTRRDSVLVAGRGRGGDPSGTRAPAKRGGVLAYPTETVYGFGGAIDRDSVDALVALKRRPPGKPFLLLIAGSDMLARLDLHLPSYARDLAARHWPGPLTLVLPGGERRVPTALRGPEGGIAVRWTSHPGSAAAHPGARRPDHVHEREPARGSAGDVGARDCCSSGATPSRAARCACSTAVRSRRRSHRRWWTAPGRARA